jgi:hypothetical protein
MNQKLIIIIISALIVLLGLGLWLYISFNKLPAATAPSAVAPASNLGPAIVPPTATLPLTVNEAERRAQLEPVVTKAIEEKRVKVDKESAGRRLTPDELDFQFHERRNVVQELVITNKISPSDQAILTK